MTDLVERFGGNFGGYAIVIWNKQGTADATCFTGGSMVGADLIPDFVRRALERTLLEDIEDDSEGNRAS